MIRAEKLASVGRLAAGIAHEIGNPIGIVLGYMELLKQDNLSREEHDDFVQRAEKEVQRINTIIRRLLDLARPKEGSVQEVSVHALIEEMIEVMRHQPLMRAIRFTTALEAPHDRIWGNADQLRQVFLNLILNAADAIQSAGRAAEGVITLATSLMANPSGPPKRWLNIDVTDNGQGIAADQLENIFDPFYTTKEPGKGTGLGLAVSYMIIEQMGGAIEVQSQYGRGTTMTLRLPTRQTPVHGPSLSAECPIPNNESK
jgi:signal transduction histidine kinase